MGYQELVLGKEAEAISGVSLTTLNRFVDAGYLQVEVDSEGVPWYSKSELLKLFKLDVATPETTAPAAASPVEQVASEPACENDDTPERAAEAKDQPAMSSEATAETAQEDLQPIPLSFSLETPSVPKDEPALRMELDRVRHLLELHEKLLDLREKQIAELKDEREWLKKRVERFEEKADRDQILLVSETQTIRKLISMQEERKSNFRLALEWLGLAKPVETRKLSSSAFIDVSSEEKRREAANA